MNLTALPQQHCDERPAGDLTGRIRDLMALHWQHGLQLPLGGAYCDIVVTASGPEAYAVVTLMDQIQHTGNERADACGPVIEDPERSWLVWLVPPGTAETWAPHRYAMCLGRPYTVSLPALTVTEPPSPFWLRPCRGDRLVPPGPLWDLLARFRPGPTPHEALLGSVLAAFS
ncbi:MULTISPECIES: hypothetical protein [unclassified Streptomyces]|uniref:hypothetical protein n=1 Tax=unclassified Streptomyces TaxID=2593676 RepID=UPI00363E6C48